MKNDFPGYYPPNPKELARLWSKATFVLDTNVLLHLYRVPESTRNQMLAVLKALKGRIWIPRHVGIEYQRRRLEVIHAAHLKAKSILTDLDKAMTQYEIALQKAELKERGVREAEAPLIQIKELAKNIRTTVEGSLAGQLLVTDHDVIREAIDDLLEGAVGPAPADQSIIDKWDEEGKRRFPMSIPPGYMDAGKSEDNPTFSAQGIVYQRQYGDLYLWLQLVDFARAKELKCVVFVTQDVKEDWWRLAPGSTRGQEPLAPHEALSEEIRTNSSVEMFWMYPLRGFLTAAQEQLNIRLTDSAINDVQRANEETPIFQEFINYAAKKANDIFSIDVETALDRAFALHTPTATFQQGRFYKAGRVESAILACVRVREVESAPSDVLMFMDSAWRHLSESDTNEASHFWLHVIADSKLNAAAIERFELATKEMLSKSRLHLIPVIFQVDYPAPDGSIVNGQMNIHLSGFEQPSQI